MEVKALKPLFLALLLVGTTAEGKTPSLFKRWEKTPVAPDGSQPLTTTPSVEGDSVRAGMLEVRMLECGFYRAPGSGKYYPIARLIFSNRDPKHRFHKNVSVEFSEKLGSKKLWRSRTFLSLKPGHGLERRYGNPGGVLYPSLLEAPALELRVRVGKTLSPALSVPVRELQESMAPLDGALVQGLRADYKGKK